MEGFVVEISTSAFDKKVTRFEKADGILYAVIDGKKYEIDGDAVGFLMKILEGGGV